MAEYTLFFLSSTLVNDSAFQEIQVKHQTSLNEETRFINQPKCAVQTALAKTANALIARYTNKSVMTTNTNTMGRWPESRRRQRRRLWGF